MRQDGSSPRDDLRARMERYLRAHHTMTVATLGPAPDKVVSTGAVAPSRETTGSGPESLAWEGNVPHAASVFYAMDDSFRLVFLSKPSSLHGRHIGESARVAVTVSEDFQDWGAIQGVQLWGEARRLTGAAKAGAFALYLRRFPFVRDLLREPRMADVARSVGVYRIVPRRAALTDNTTGVFGREVLELVVE